jgi:hypothetical protein
LRFGDTVEEENSNFEWKKERRKTPLLIIRQSGKEHRLILACGDHPRCTVSGVHNPTTSPPTFKLE